MALTLPQSAERYGREQRAEISAALGALSRQWRRMGEDFDTSYAKIEPAILAVLDTAQERVATGAVEYIPDVMAETGQPVWPPSYQVDPWRLVGTSGDGYGTDSLAYGAVTHAKAAIGRGASIAQALVQGGRYLTTASGTMLSDTGRTAERMTGASRGVTLWVRMLEPPSCGRCVILAGKETRNSEAFDRHPRCDCRNIPTTENLAGSMVTDPREYLDGLSERELARALGSQANARAYLDGADPNQVINAYRRKMLADGTYTGGVRSAQVYGEKVRYATEGVTRRGQAYRSMRRAGYAGNQADVRTKGDRYFQARAPRLMPSTIYEIATDATDARRLLRLYGWIG